MFPSGVGRRKEERGGGKIGGVHSSSIPYPTDGRRGEKEIERITLLHVMCSR